LLLWCCCCHTYIYFDTMSKCRNDVIIVIYDRQLCGRLEDSNDMATN